MQKVSVIIPVYNRTFSIRDAVESVLIQSIKPSEIIVIDDGSSFNMQSYLKNYLSHINLITLEENKGVSFARNTGIKAARGEYIAFLDSDDLFLPEKLSCQIQFMQENNYLVSHTNEFWYRKGKWINQGKTNNRYGGFILDKILDKCRISPSSLIVHKSVFDEAGMFNEDLRVCEDYELSLRIAARFKIGYLEKKLIIKRAVEENSLSAGILHIEYIRYNILCNFYEENKSFLSTSDREKVEKEILRKQQIISKFI